MIQREPGTLRFGCVVLGCIKKHAGRRATAFPSGVAGEPLHSHED